MYNDNNVGMFTMVGTMQIIIMQINRQQIQGMQLCKETQDWFQMTTDRAIDIRIISRSASYVCMSHQRIVNVEDPVNVEAYPV